MAGRGGQNCGQNNGFHGLAVGARWETLENDDGRFKPKSSKELRVSAVAPESTAARFTAEDWSRMAERLGLPEREMLFQVVKGLVAMMTDDAIQYALDIKRGTMRRYMTRLFRRFGTHCRGEIAMKAVEAMHANDG